MWVYVCVFLYTYIDIPAISQAFPSPTLVQAPPCLIFPARTESAREPCCKRLKHSGLLHRPHFAQSSPTRIIYNGD